MALLEPLAEDWARGLAVVAHPDDMEYGGAAAIARWTRQGKWFGYVLVSAGEAGMKSVDPDDAGPVRRSEQIASCRVVGVTDVEFLGHRDGTIVEDLALRADLTAAIRRHRPEVVVSINFRESWGGSSWNHADHRAVGRALLDAVRDSANPWVFPDRGAAWDGVRFVAFAGSPQPTHAVDVTDTIDDGMRSLECHRSYLESLGDDPAAALEWLRSSAASAGEQFGVPFAASFEVIG